MKLSDLQVNEEKAIEGQWMDAGAGLKLKVARLNNKRYKAYVKKLSRPHLNAIRRGSLNLDDMTAIAVKAMAKHVLLDWKNLTDDNGKDISYSVQKAEELLLKYSELQNIVEEMATEISFTEESDDEDAAGNSDPS